MGTGLYCCGYSERTRGNGLKLRQGRFSSDVRKKNFIFRVVSELMESPSLEVLKNCQDLALSNGLVVWELLE